MKAPSVRKKGVWQLVVAVCCVLAVVTQASIPAQAADTKPRLRVLLITSIMAGPWRASLTTSV